MLSQAQAITEDKGLQRLAQSISSEHDMLLTQLPQWEALKTFEAPLAEASELSGIEGLLTHLVRQRAVEPPDFTPKSRSSS